MKFGVEMGLGRRRGIGKDYAQLHNVDFFYLEFCTP